MDSGVSTGIDKESRNTVQDPVEHAGHAACWFWDLSSVREWEYVLISKREINLK